MKFRPCIDIHDGKVKQIVGSSLSDLDSAEGPKENFVADKEAAYFAKMYQNDGLTGGHIINLNKKGTPEYEKSKAAAIEALKAFPGGMQYGGGVDDTDAKEFIDAGASHVIVTSYVFNNGRVDYDALRHLADIVGREHLVLDLSCKRVGKDYYIVTDRWQRMTKEIITYKFLDKLAAYSDEFLIHAADVEGQQGGIDRDLVGFLADFKGVPITYAGGINSCADIELISYLSGNRMNFTIGSALDIFGGNLSYEKIVSKVATR